MRGGAARTSPLACVGACVGACVRAAGSGCGYTRRMANKPTSRAEALSFGRCERLLSSRGLTLTRCDRLDGEVSFTVRDAAKKSVGEAILTPQTAPGRLTPDLKVAYIELDPGRRGDRIGTTLYEAFVAEACARGSRLVSDSKRSRFAEAFWVKQKYKRRARCVKYARKGGVLYTLPTDELRDDLEAGKITRAQYDAILDRLPEPMGSAWACHHYEISTPCKTRSLEGMRRKKGRRRG